MRVELTLGQIEQYTEHGFLLIPDLMYEEVGVIRENIERSATDVTPGRMLEKDGNTLRGLRGTHLTNEFFARLVRYPKILIPAQRLLDSNVYVYQFKVNIKRAFTGDMWQWHQDFSYWHHEDGMPAPQALTAVIFIDRANETNGPLLLIPGSHRSGLIPVERSGPAASDTQRWTSNFTAGVNFTVPNQVVIELANRYGITAAMGEPGTVLFFAPNVVHGSPQNMSPFDRTMLFTTYNSVDNRLREVKNPRPGFIVTRNGDPISPLDHELSKSCLRPHSTS
ncbi:MAG TPA: phytanoyl-CoA dioxygenase family protein [Pseudonocardiaceae bacterium]|nr:phytanoyl-CoA dioxygenase family protein [Pseudonocardiaceae bacterium]